MIPRRDRFYLHRSRFVTRGWGDAETRRMEPSPRPRVSASPRRPLRRFSDSVRDMRAVFADCHVGRRPDDDGPFLAGLDEAARRGAKSISLLGDIFHFFI